MPNNYLQKLVQIAKIDKSNNTAAVLVDFDTHIILQPRSKVYWMLSKNRKGMLWRHRQL